MNREQWFTFGIGLLILGTIMGYESSFWFNICLPNLDVFPCMTRNIYGMLSRVFGFLGFIFIIGGYLEQKEKK